VKVREGRLRVADSSTLRVSVSPVALSGSDAFGIEVVTGAAKLIVDSGGGKVGIAKQEVVIINKKIKPAKNSPLFIASSSSGVYIHLYDRAALCTA
jgi:hypothetical protein